MSKAKDNFYRIKSICSMNVINYVDELESEKAELLHEFTVLKNGCKNEAIQCFCESVLNKYKEK